MTSGFMGDGLVRVARIVFCAAVAFAAGPFVHARQAPAPTLNPAQGQAPSAQTPATGREAQPPAPATPAGRGEDQGAVRGPAGEIIGFTKTAEIPGTPWRIHDAARPHPRAVTPGATPGAPPSDALVLFDGKDLSRWGQ